ncbi:hypothetical protein AVHY2522_04455 [Acidovorax sp. SUPP2522]|nr:MULTISPECIES: hypothetical protein [unclassified Acidovorax]WCM99796.1 hypothetical protein M5C96_10560 [Acidovorax sp. GBBC 1281]GKT14402.1 hypothetical protein AVHY2522_04455 [Acidovorax sp. SUPP2522]
MLISVAAGIGSAYWIVQHAPEASVRLAEGGKRRMGSACNPAVFWLSAVV